MTTPPLPDDAYVVALLGLPEMWMRRLGDLLGQRRAVSRTPGALFDAPVATPPLRRARQVWELILSGAVVDLMRDWRLPIGTNPSVLANRWRAAAPEIDVGRVWARYARVSVDLLGDPGYPADLARHEDAPPVLFRTGAVADLADRRVAIVGTREATAAGKDIARELGAGLARSGVRVISGLALGIDAHAHLGALAAAAAPPIGVVAGGFDVPYPARHRHLWREVAAAGTLVSEWPLGTRSLGWRFPARNRIIAALAEIVVVVESRGAGGSMTTADIAIDRGIPVMAVPGSLRNPVAAGTNRLLRDGMAPVTGPEDVLDALGLPLVAETQAPVDLALDTTESTILAAVGWAPTPTDRIVAATGLRPVAALSGLARLEMRGLIAGGAGGWHRVGPATH